MLDYPLSILARVLNAELHASPEAVVRGVVADSRNVRPGDLFVALPGERTDGHNHVAAALEAGATAALVAGDRTPADRPWNSVLRVPDPLTALSQLAAWHRNRFPALRVVAVTGSVGKTTTKDLVAGVLAAKWTTLKSPGNLNTEIGLPLALLGLEPGHQAAVVELGMRGPGQIRSLAVLARPQVAVITNIGMSHVEVLGSQEAIAAAKAEVLDFIPQGGWAVLPADDAYCPLLQSRVPAWSEAVTFGASPGPAMCSYQYSGASHEYNADGAPAWGSNFRLLVPGSRRAAPAFVPLLGRHNAANAAAAAAAGWALGLPLAAIRSGLATAAISGQRMAAFETAGGLLLDDSYNASSPETMEAALGVLGELDGRKVAVLADMLELGEHSEAAHCRVGKAVAAAPPDLLITVGAGGEVIAAAAVAAGLARDRVRWWPNRAEAIADLRETRRQGDVTLVKGSRGMQMEEVVAALREAG